MRSFSFNVLSSLCFVCLLGLVGCAVKSARGPETNVAPNENAHLAGLAINAVDIGTEIKEYVVPFTLASVPDHAALHFQFGVVSKGVCPTTYTPTTITVNSKSVASLDFRNFARGTEKDISVPVPNGILKVGENLLYIRTGSCQYDIDVMRLNSLTLVQK